MLILQAENCGGICDIGLRASNCIHKASDYRFGYGQIAGLFVRVSLVKIHRHWHGNLSGNMHSELRQNHPNVTVLIDLARVMLPNALDVLAQIH